MHQYRQQFASMGCPCEIRVCAEQPSVACGAIEAAIAEVDRVDEKYSLYRDDSLVAVLNSSAGTGKNIPVDEETAALLDYAEGEYQLSNGLFDITAGSLWQIWDFHAASLPDEIAVLEALSVTGWEMVQWQRPFICLPIVGLTLDFGGIAKEYAADRAAVILREHGIRHGLVDLGGDFSVAGPHPAGNGWAIGIKDPTNPVNAAAIIELTCGGLATSGDYERYIEIDGVRYSHIINPKSGWPVSGYASISVQASSCLAAGAISTTAMLKGKPGGHGFLSDCGLAFLTIDQDGVVITAQQESTRHVQTHPDHSSPQRHATG